MPLNPNPNKFTIKSNSTNYQDSYYSNGGSGIDLHSPVSMEMSYQLVQASSYLPTENDFVIVCDTVNAAGDIDIDLSPLSSTCKNGKILVIKKLTDGNVYNVNLINANIDGNPSYSWTTDYYGVMIVFDKIANLWYILSNEFTGYGYATLGSNTFTGDQVINSSLSNGESLYIGNLYAHAEGFNTSASGKWSHTEGSFTEAIGFYSHAEGANTVAYGDGSHAGGFYTIASGTYQTVVGVLNTHNNTTDLFVVGGGDGSGPIVRKDVFTVSTSSIVMSASIRISGSLNINNGITGSLQGTSSWATNALTASFLPVGTYQVTSSWTVSSSQAITSSFARTASFVNTLNQNVIITGSVAIGTGSIGNGENNLLLGPAPAGGTGEGGQIGLLAVGGTYTSSSFLDNYQNQFRILSGPGATSNTGVLAIDLGTRNATFQGAVTASGFNGLPNDYLYVTRNTSQTIGAGTWANQDVIFNNSVVSKGISYNTSTGLATLTGGKVYRITARLAWNAAATYLFQFSCYTSANAQIGPTTEMVQSTNGTNNISDGTLDFIYAPGSNTDIKIRTTNNTTALTGEYIRGDLNTQLIIQQIA